MEITTACEEQDVLESPQLCPLDISQENHCIQASCITNSDNSNLKHLYKPITTSLEVPVAAPQAAEVFGEARGSDPKALNDTVELIQESPKDDSRPINAAEIMSEKECRPVEDYVGSKVRKKFKQGWFNGTISRFRTKGTQSETGVLEENLWSIQYEDGDEEDMSAEELHLSMQEYERYIEGSGAELPSPIENDENNDKVALAVAEMLAATDSNGTWCPKGWRISSRTNPKDAKSKPGETYTVWIAPNGKEFKTKAGAVSRLLLLLLYCQRKANIPSIWHFVILILIIYLKNLF